MLTDLQEHGTLSLADLADEVAVREHDRPLPEIPAESVKQIYLSLYHTHIPKLEEANLVEYSQTRDAVTAGAAINRAAPFLTLAEDAKAAV